MARPTSPAEAASSWRPRRSGASDVAAPAGFWQLQAVFGKLRTPEPADELASAWSALSEAPSPSPRGRAERDARTVAVGTARPAWLGPEPSQPPPSTVVYDATRRRFAEPSCFDLLGLERHSEPEAVKRRYRELVKRHHPDRGGRQEDFVEISRAYAQALRVLLGIE